MLSVGPVALVALAVDAFGDLTRVTVAKVGEGVNAGISAFTGKPKYAFGDLTKAAITKLFAPKDERVAHPPRQAIEGAAVEPEEAAENAWVVVEEQPAEGVGEPMEAEGWEV